MPADDDTIRPAAARARTRRGAYAKGVAKREEILARALEVIAQDGYRGASVRRLAREVGLSEAGLLHYFGSKDELFTEVLRARDRADASRLHPAGRPADDPATLREDYVGIIRHNMRVPGLVQLFSRLAVDAADPGHPAHEFFVRRGEALRTTFAGAVAQAARRASDPTPGHTAHAPSGPDAETSARIIQAVSDGLQLQWMLEPDAVDMAAITDALLAVLIPARGEADDRPRPAPVRGEARG